MALKVSKQQLFNDAGNSSLPFRSLSDTADWNFEQMKSELRPEEVLVALYWPKPGGNEDMKVTAIPDAEDFKEFLDLSAKPLFLFQCFQALPKNVAKSIGVL